MKYILGFILAGFLGLGVADKTLAQTCYTKDQVTSSCALYNKCFYLYDKPGNSNNGVYQYGTCASRHQGHPCGTDVSNILPSFHLTLGNIFLNAKIASLCASPTPPQTGSRDVVVDGKVNLFDFGYVARKFGLTGAGGFDRADIYQNGGVDFIDLRLVTASAQ